MYAETSSCVGCLSTGRSLSPSKSFSSVKFNDIKIFEIDPLVGKLCWECQALIIKFYNFKIQLSKANMIITNQEPHFETLSKLSYETKCTYDYEFVEQDILHEEIKLEIDHEPPEYYEDFDGYNNEMEEFYEESEQEDDKKEIRKLLKEKEVNVDNRLIQKDIKEDIESFTEVDGAVNNFHNLQSSPHVSTSSLIEDNCKTITQDVNKHTTNGLLIQLLNSKSISLNMKPPGKEINLNVNDEIPKIKVQNYDRNLVTNLLEDKYEMKIYTDEELLKIKRDKCEDPNFKKRKFKCESCVIMFCRQYTFEEHMAEKHSESLGLHLCPICEQRFPSVCSMKNHKRKHHTVYKCRLCSYNTPIFKWILRHCEEMHSQDSVGSIHCTNCREVFETPEMVEQHIKTDHSIICNECGLHFKEKGSLVSHLRNVHSAARKFACEVCCKTFHTRTQMESHLFRHGTAAAQRLTYCADCDLQYNTMLKYRNHIKYSLKHNEATYPCPECDKKFINKGYWNKHYRIRHLNMKRHTCDICGEKFVEPIHLKTHMHRKHGHDRSRDHECDICQKKFFTPGILRNHRLIHSNLRSFMCAECGDTFKQKSALFIHTKLIHKTFPKKKKRNKKPSSV